MVLLVDFSAKTIHHHPSASCQPACFPNIMKHPRQKQARRSTMAQLTSNTTPCTTTITSSTRDPAATNAIARRRNTAAHSTCAKATRSGSPPTMTQPALAAYTNLIPTRPSPLAYYQTAANPHAAANQQQRGIKLLLLGPRRDSTGMLGVFDGGRTDSTSTQSDAAATEAATPWRRHSSSSITISANGAVGGNNFAHLTKEEKVERIVADPLQWSKLQRELRMSEKSFRCASASSAANDNSDASGADGRTQLTTSMAVRQRLLTSSLLDERLYEMQRLKIALRETEVEDGDGCGVTSPDAEGGRGFMRKFAAARRAGRRATMHF